MISNVHFSHIKLLVRTLIQAFNVLVLTIYAAISPYKFSRLVSMHFLRELVGRN